MTSKSITLFVCPTTHIDWDWINDFEQYYAIGYPGSSSSVEYTLDQVFSLLQTRPDFAFNLAEMGYFRRYFLDKRPVAEVLAAGPRLALMGGGVTSPDNLLSHGEAFIRNYLLGSNWLASQGISSARAPLAWLPDDFGHDPQLPVVLAALGMTAVAFSRVPGSWQGSPDVKPLVKGQTNVAYSLTHTDGLVFPWVAADGSQVLAHFMPYTYAASINDLAFFVENFFSAIWSGTNMFIPVPAPDFATPTLEILNAIDAYNNTKANGVTAQIGTFADFVDAVLATPENLPPAFTLQASNYWCGQFASRPQLKIDHYASVRDLLAAEVALSLLQAASKLGRSPLDALNSTIESVWWAVAATTHHDFITGTAPDHTYRREQLPLSTQTRALARATYESALGLLSSVVCPTETTGLPYVIFNPLGFSRTGLVELHDLHQSIASVSGAGSTIVQRGADGALLFLAPQVPSFGYVTVAFQAGSYISPAISALGDTLVWNNGLIEVTFSASAAWSITSMIDLSSGTQIVASGGTAGALWIYHDDGNLYQFGNEPVSDNGETCGSFVPERRISDITSATVTENGPLRWSLLVTLTDRVSGEFYNVTSTLHAQETFIRISVTGRAPNRESAVVVTSAVADADGTLPNGITHGTPYHWNDVMPVRYWEGPTFQATHDYLLPTVGGIPVAAFYHGGMPAWCLDQGTAEGVGAGKILGVLLRNSNGIQRGAAGTDDDIHTQHFAIGVAGTGGLDPRTCAPLQMGLSFATPLSARALNLSVTVGQALPATLSLAGVTSGIGMLRAARPQQGSAGITSGNVVSKKPPFSVVLRVYSPTNDLETKLAIDLPAFLDVPSASIVTALELPPESAGLAQPECSVSAADGGISVAMGAALCSVQLIGSRRYVEPLNGRYRVDDPVAK